MKVSLSDVSSGYNLQAINNNFQILANELNSNVLYRDNPVGEPNQMIGSNLDMNFNRILNLPMPQNENEPARLKDVQAAISGNSSALLVSYVPNTILTSTNVQGALDQASNYFLSLTAKTANVTVVGGTPNGTTDNTADIIAALNLWKSVGGRLEFGPGQWRVSAPIVIDMDGILPGDIVMYGNLQPDAAIGDAITIKNSRGGNYQLRVRGGGVTADYTVADPVGGDRAFVFTNFYQGTVGVEGGNYKGRCLHINSGPVGSQGFSTQWVTVKYVNVNSTAPITAAESTRLAAGVGQAFFIISGTNAFGNIENSFHAWELYGSIIENTTDISFKDVETIYRGNTGMKLRGVISFRGTNMKLGSELAGWTDDLLFIGDSSTRNSQNVSISYSFLVGGYNGLRAVNVGLTTGQGLSLDDVVTRVNTNAGIVLDSVRKFNITNAQCWADNVGVWFTGTDNLGDAEIHTLQTKAQGIRVDSTVLGQIIISGSAVDGNTNAVAGVALVQVDTLNIVQFRDFTFSSANVDYLIKNPSGSLVRIYGGQVVTGGTSQIFQNQPNRVKDVVGWITANIGSKTMLNGTSSIAVDHGLIRAPDNVKITARSSQGAVHWWSTPTATQFTINVPSNLTADTTFDWEARVNYAGA